MIDALSLIELDALPDVVSLRQTADGRDLLRIFNEIDAAHPEFFGAVASMAGLFQPNGIGEEGRINEGKRMLALELLAILKLSMEPEETEQ